jgi:hypothetical protein
VAVAQAGTGTPAGPRAAPHVGPVRRLVRTLDRDGFYRLLTLGIAAVLWEVGANASTSLLIPSFSETATAFAALLSDPRW